MGIIINEEYEKYRKYIKKNLKKNRYIHSIGVAYTSSCLAMRYGYDENKALITGILHDIAKCLDYDDLIYKCKKAKLDISDNEIKNPELLHSKYGSILVKELFNIEDEDIINSIYYHTTGRANMSLLEKIVFVADYIEPSRSSLKQMDKIRELAFTNIDDAIVLICKNTIDYLNSKSKDIDQITIDTYNFYKKG